MSDLNVLLDVCNQRRQLITLLELHSEQEVITIDESMVSLEVKTRKIVTDLFNIMMKKGLGRYIAGKGGPSPTRFEFSIPLSVRDEALRVLRSSGDTGLERLLKKDPSIDGLKKALKAIENVYDYKSPFN